jgi:hypothetical protein
LKTYNNKIGGLNNAQLKASIVVNNLYLGIEGTKTNFDNIRQFLFKLQGKEREQDEINELDQLDRELIKQAPTCKLRNQYYFTYFYSWH